MDSGTTIATLVVLVLLAIVIACMYVDPKRVINAIAIIAIATLSILWFQNSAETRHHLYVAFAGSDTSAGHTYARDERYTPAHKQSKKLASSTSKWGDM